MQVLNIKDIPGLNKIYKNQRVVQVGRYIYCVYKVRKEIGCWDLHDAHAIREFNQIHREGYVINPIGRYALIRELETSIDSIFNPEIINYKGEL